HWIKRLDQASDYAVSEAFSLQKSRYPQGPRDPVTSLETVEQLQDHEACEEAQELLRNWMKSKLQPELMSDGEEEVDSVLEKPSAAPLKYERFDDLCSSLEHELEGSSVQEYLQHLLQSEDVNCGIMEDLRLEDIKENQKCADPRIIMELRHKQVKENRMRRQKALELQRQEKSLKKSALFEARLQAQEEDRRKALKAKKEEEEIQREMVKLRKAMAEKRHTTAEARRIREQKEERSAGKAKSDEGKGGKDQHLCDRLYLCMQRHFSAWLKVVLKHRIKMGKARALADWKCQLKALRAWRNYTWAQKVEQETQQLEVHLQDQNRKTQLSAEHNQRRLLRCCFLAWQRWSRAETEKRELQIKREETKRKMAQLLEAVSLGKGAPDRLLEVNKPGTAEVNHHQDLQQNKVNPSHVVFGISVLSTPTNAQDQTVYRNQTATVPKQFQAPGPKTAPVYGSCFEHRHAFQRRLIEEQRQQLRKQQELILELQENQRLSRAKEEAAQATAVTQPLNSSASQTREEKLKREKQSRCKNTTHLRYIPSIKQAQLRSALSEKVTHAKLNFAFFHFKAQLKAEEEARQRKEAEEKEAQQQKRQEERRQQKLKELEKQRRQEKEQQLQKKARDHYEKVLLRKLGMVPWKRLREQTKENLVVAQRHHCLGLQRKCLMTWHRDTQGSLMEKVSRAQDFYFRMLLRRGRLSAPEEHVKQVLYCWYFASVIHTDISSRGLWVRIFHAAWKRKFSGTLHRTFKSAERAYSESR
uniref:Coiled-coil domain containing 191 n=1 Tax=Strix occidentalis caurina TaxID=311401 RepID=A0A8D0KQI3_STROC